ncbi:MAG TPA: thioesterase family protein [Jatrophihabitantaceae bacterium]|nr:thioesterase family protein [Jatrophihabitantaceae bacterium]
MPTSVDYGHVEIVRVYFDDLDAMGVLHNGRYGVLFERALARYWERAGWSFDPSSPHFADVFFVVREFSITYHLPITSVGDVQVHLWLDDLRTSSGVYGFRILSADGSVVHAEGRRVQVKLDPTTLRPSPIPEAVLADARPLLARS